MTGTELDGDGTAVRPGDAFALLGNETRMDVLRALWEVRDPFAPAAENALSFSALREQVGIDDPGQFNYHLNQLVGRFVRRTDEGYVLRKNAVEVLRAVVTGSVTAEDQAAVRTEATEPCPLCGAVVEVEYVDSGLTVRCTECPGEYRSRVSPEGTLMSSAFFPPMGVDDRDGQALWEALSDYVATRAFGFLRGVCPECAAPPTVAVDACPDHAREGICERCGSTQPVMATVHCETCSTAWRFPAWVAALTHPEVVGFFHARGIDADGGLTLAAYNRLLTARQVVDSTDPVELAVTVEVAGDELAVTVDGALSVVDVRS